MPDWTSKHAPGFLAVSGTRGGRALRDAVRSSGTAFATLGPVEVATWGLDPEALVRGEPVVLGLLARRHEHELGDRGAVADVLAEDRRLAEMMPPFAALRRLEDGVEAVTDSLGFRHVYYGTSDGAAAVSTSARAVARWLGAPLDRRGVAVQSLLGWQLDDRTLHRGVRKLAAGCRLVLTDGRVTVTRYAVATPPDPIDLEEAVPEAARLLRRYLDAYLDEHPGAVLQLTGGQDSRLLLSAVDERRRRGLRVMTLGVPQDPDVRIARRIAARYGLDHTLVSMSGLEVVGPATAHAMCTQAAARLEGMADPVAFASLGWAETRVDQGPRLSGLGGEVARGFYYFGPSLRLPVTRGLSAALASWRMLVNEAVTPAALEPELVARGRRFTVDEIHRLLLASGRDWFSATDELYLWQRMQRWAGVTDSAVAFDRPVTNPMLDDRFLAIARGLRPSDKRGSRFLSRLQLELDPELAHEPLAGRPAPVAYTRRSVVNAARLSTATGASLVRKARQRLNRQSRPPMGGEVLAAKVVEHWRQEPDVLDPVRGLGIVREDWLDSLLAGRTSADASTVSFLVSMSVAAGE